MLALYLAGGKGKPVRIFRIKSSGIEIRDITNLIGIKYGKNAGRYVSAIYKKNA